MHNVLKKVIKIAGDAMEKEDTVIIGFITGNKSSYPNNCGILRFNNEHHYQYIITRALLSLPSYSVVTEVDNGEGGRYDIVFYDTSINPGKKYFLVVEMKRWMSSTGDPEIPWIKDDVDKLNGITDSECKLLLILSSNPKNQMSENIEYLSDKINNKFGGNIDKSQWVTHCFNTIDPKGDEVEFWIAGYELS